MGSNCAHTIKHHENSTDASSSEDILRQIDSYIVMNATKLMYHHPSSINNPPTDLEIDELIQRSRIKLWRMLEKSAIAYPYSYARRIIYSEFIDMQRVAKHTLPLPADDNEAYELAERQSDPADEVIQHLEDAAVLKTIVQMVVALPPRQRLAMICFLQDQVDDPQQLFYALRIHHIEVHNLTWPKEKAEKQLLLASLSVARRKLAMQLARLSADLV